MLFKKVFTAKEIDTFRAYAEKDKSHTGDLLSSPLLSKVILDERIINIYKSCTGSDSLVYFGDSSLSYNVGLTGFHKDSKDRFKVDSEEFKDNNYSLLRLGIYLQDHSKHSKGLCLRDASHQHQSIHKGKIVNVKSEVGDVIIWKLTTTHSPNADIISFLPNYSFNPKYTKRLPDFIKLPAITPRLALFMCFGIDDHYTKAYIEYLKTRAYAINRWKDSNYSDETIRIMENNKVQIIEDLNLENITQDSLNVNYKQL